MLKRIAIATLYSSAIALSGIAYAQPSNGANSFRMTAAFSDQAGLYQYIQLWEKSGLNDQNHFTGLTLEVTSHKGVYKSYTFQSDLPSVATAGRPVLIGTTHAGPPDTDFALPPGFLPTDGGTLVFAGVDRWDYAQLPTDGYSVALRDGGIASAPPGGPPALIVHPFSGFPTGLNALIDPVIEYYNPSLDHYFITASQPDIDALDSGRYPFGGWQRTGQVFPAWISPLNCCFGASSPPGIAPVCRLYLAEGTSSSHFFSASADECSAALAQHPDYLLETRKAFLASLPDRQTGACGYDQIPVYRLWNARVDSNHRYTTSPAIRDLMKGRGYIAEGYGPDAVAMCVGGMISGD